MSDLHIGDRVSWRGRVFYVRGFSPMGVQPRSVPLEDELTREQSEVPLEEVKPEGNPKRAG